MAIISGEMQKMMTEKLTVIPSILEHISSKILHGSPTGPFQTHLLLSFSGK
jgi:hypothetical protein